MAVKAKRERARAFTLIELLVVISIIALLLAILMPALRRTRAQAREVVCRSQLKQTVLGALLWAEDHDDWVVGMFWFTGYEPPHDDPAHCETSLYPYTKGAFLKRQWYNEMPNSELKEKALAQNNGLYSCPSMTEGMFRSFPSAVEWRDDPSLSKRFAQQDVDGKYLSYGVNEAAIEGEPGGPGRAVSRDRDLDDFSCIRDHGRVKISSITRPSDVVYFMDHLNYEPDLKSFIFDGNVYLIGIAPKVWRWHRNKTSANLGWFDGHVSPTPGDFLERIRHYYKGSN